MPRFLIERDIPDAGTMGREELRDASAKSNDVLGDMRAERKNILWEHSYVANDRVFCVYIADSEDLIREHAERSGFPATTVTPLRKRIDPTTAGRGRLAASNLVHAEQSRMRRPRPLFTNRAEAGQKLAGALRPLPDDAIVVGLARGGAVVAAALARALGRQLDVLAVRKIGHPAQPEYALGAVAASGEPYIRGHESLTSDDTRDGVATAAAEAASLDAALHAGSQALSPCWQALRADRRRARDRRHHAGRRQVAQRGGAREITVAVPVGARRTVAALERVVDRVVCLESPRDFVAVGLYYEDFRQVDNAEVVRLLEQKCRPPNRGDSATDTRR